MEAFSSTRIFPAKQRFDRMRFTLFLRFEDIESSRPPCHARLADMPTIASSCRMGTLTLVALRALS